MANPISEYLQERRYTRLREKYNLTNFPDSYRGLSITFPAPFIPLHPDEVFFFFLHRMLSEEVAMRCNYAGQLLDPNTELGSRYPSVAKTKKDALEDLFEKAFVSSAKLNQAFDQTRMQSSQDPLASALNEVFEIVKTDITPQYHDISMGIAQNSLEAFRQKHTGLGESYI